MTSILETIPGLVGDAFKDIFFDAVLTRVSVTPGSDPFDPRTGTTATQTFACKAIHEEYSVGYKSQSLIQAGDFKIMILAASLATEPLPGDRIDIASRGVSGVVVPESTSGQQAVTTDPAKAVWNCRCRK